MSELVYTIY